MTLPERGVPTLWLPSPNDDARTKAAFEILEKENRFLKDLVVRLTEMVLRSVVAKNRHEDCYRPEHADPIQRNAVRAIE